MYPIGVHRLSIHVQPTPFTSSGLIVPPRVLLILLKNQRAPKECKDECVSRKFPEEVERRENFWLRITHFVSRKTIKF